MRDHSLDAERAVAVRTIDAFYPHRAWAWERDAKAGTYSAARLCVKSAATSDGLVLILGDELTPITKREYHAARRSHVPRFLLLKDPSTHDAAAASFVRRERMRVVTRRFRNERELRTHIRESLAARILHTSRADQAVARTKS
jgi:hypothetical protein